MLPKSQAITTPKKAQQPQPRTRARVRAHETRGARFHASRRTRTTRRMTLLEAFQTMAHGVEPKTAFGQTKAFYRTSIGEWSRALS